MRIRPALLATLLLALSLGPPRATVPRDLAEEATPRALELVPAESRIYFVGIKDNEVPVTGSFTGLRGLLDIESRSAWVEIPLGSLDTGLEERDQNIRTHLFADYEHPLAQFVTESVAGPVHLPAVGGTIQLEAIGRLRIRGQPVKVVVPLRMHREGEQRLRLQTTRPFVLTKEQLGLEHAFSVLQVTCGVAVSGAIPVQLDLVFEGEVTSTSTRL